METQEILDMISHNLDEYFSELNEGVMATSDIEQEGVTMEELKKLEEEGKIVIEEVLLTNPESANNNKVYIEVAYLPGTPIYYTEH